MNRLKNTKKTSRTLEITEYTDTRHRFYSKDYRKDHQEDRWQRNIHRYYRNNDRNCSKHRKDDYSNYNYIRQYIQSSNISLKESSESNDFRPKYTGNNWTMQARNTRIYSVGIRKHIQEELGYVLEKVQHFIQN